MTNTINDTMIYISQKELDMLREKKSVEITEKDIEDLIEYKDLFIRWLTSEKLLYQIKLGNLQFLWKSIEAEYAILCLKNTIERLQKLDDVIEQYNKGA